MIDEIEALAQRLCNYAEAEDLFPQERADLYEAARRLSAQQGKGVPEGWKLVPVDGLCPDCRYAYNSDACRESHEAAPEPPK
jgi:hypothetical protein